MTLPSIFLHKPNHWLKHLRMASVYTTTSHKIQAADTDLPIGSWWSFIAWDPSFSRTFLVHLVQLPSFSGPNVISGCSNQHFFMVQKNFQPEINIFSRWLNQHFSGSFHGWYTSPFFQIKKTASVDPAKLFHRRLPSSSSTSSMPSVKSARAEESCQAAQRWAGERCEVFGATMRDDFPWFGFVWK